MSAAAALMMIAGLGGCRSDELGSYENDPKLYFFKGNHNYGQIVQDTSTRFSFKAVDPEATRWNVDVYAQTMGLLSESDRPYEVEQVITGVENEAVAGKHFVPFDDPAYGPLHVVPANTVLFPVPVILLKDPSLAEQEVTLTIRFKANANFKPGIEAQSKFTITYSDMLAEPANWNSWRYSFGPWSSEKMEFIMRYVGITDFDNPSNDMGEINYLKALATQKLLEQMEANPDWEPGFDFNY